MAAINPPTRSATRRTLVSSAQLVALVGATCILTALAIGAVAVAILVELGTLSR